MNREDGACRVPALLRAAAVPRRVVGMPLAGAMASEPENRGPNPMNREGGAYRVPVLLRAATVRGRVVGMPPAEGDAR
jgi:hypothetical protein